MINTEKPARARYYKSLGIKSLYPIVAGLMAATLMAPAVTNAAVIGFLGNFDVINDTGSTAHGFEIDLEGIHSTEVTDVFGGPGRGFPTGRGFDPATSVERYGSPDIAEYSNGTTYGTKITYHGLFIGGSWDYGTPSGTFITPGDNCWSGGGVGYSAATPCDHFGVGTVGNPTKTTYSWLLETSTPGQLTNGVVTLPAPTWTVQPSPVVGAPPVVVAQVVAPQPILEEQFGDALWVKVFTTELEDPIDLEELVAGNAKVEQAVTEIEWQLLQKDPGNPNSGVLESGYGAPVGPNAASILRRYEFYKYAGEYDPETHEALMAGTDSNPGKGDVGNYLGAQNAAANLIGDPIAPVPVPASVWLMLSGLGGLGFISRKRKSAM